MGQRVYFIPADSAGTQTQAQCDYLSRITEEVVQAFPQECGFLRLVQYKKNGQSLDRLIQSGPFYYYGRSLNAIVGDLVSGSYRREIDWSDIDWRQSLFHLDKATNCLLDNVLHIEEFNRFQDDWFTTFPNRKLEDCIAVISANSTETVKKWDPSLPVYYIPIHRCNHGDWNECVAELLEAGYLPCVDSKGYRELTGSKPFWDWLASYSNKNEPAASQPTEEAILAALKKFKELDSVRSRIPPYTDEIFQVNRGSWDLLPYTVYSPSHPPEDSSGPWLDLREWKQEIYARDPREDIATDGEWAAIDFGTRSTIVAVWLDNSIQMRRIGMQESQTYTDEELENPTILCFNNTDAFLAAYHSKQPGRPSTKFDQLTVAREAEVGFSALLTADDVTLSDLLRFQDQLKQWADDPDRSIYVKYNNDFHELKYAALPEGAPDPIEIYAYYIGLYLNNMLQGKIHLKYLLSYSATYFKGNLDRIHNSFVRGLKRSLPREVVEDEELMKNFEVKLYLDEATAYAVSALIRYRTQAANYGKRWTPEPEEDIDDLPSLQDYTDAIENSGLFYGVYDFGGGTLDYSFGYMTCEIIYGNGRNIPRNTFHPLERGGSSYAGCENILEDLAYQVFFENRAVMQANNLRCLAPPRLKNTANNPLIGTSPAARFNTFQLIETLRDAWIDQTFTDILFRLLPEGESKQTFDAVLQEKETGQEQKTVLKLKLKKGIEAFFQERIQTGIENFMWQFDYTAQKHNKADAPRFIFLGGNASKASMVSDIFNRKIEKEKERGTVYYLHPVLPTGFDKYTREEQMDISCATAKSGVVYGMLLARPDAISIRVKNLEMPFRYFQYHLGLRIPDVIFFDPDGLFSLIAGANDLRPSVFRYIGPIPSNGKLELLYTRKPEYGFPREGGELSAALAEATTINLNPDNLNPDNLNPDWRGKNLYCRPARGSDTVLELWLSQQKQAELADEHFLDAFIGRFAFKPTPHYIPFDPDSVCIRFCQADQPPSDIYSVSELPAQNMDFDWVAFYTPAQEMYVQFGTRAQVESGDGVGEMMLPDDFLRDQKAEIFCCRTDACSDYLLLLAYNGEEKLGEYRLGLWEQSLI